MRQVDRLAKASSSAVVVVAVVVGGRVRPVKASSRVSNSKGKDRPVERRGTRARRRAKRPLKLKARSPRRARHPPQAELDAFHLIRWRLLARL